MKTFFVETFQEQGFRPQMISHSIFDSIPEPQVEEGSVDRVVAGAPPKFQDILLTGQIQTRPSERMGEQLMGRGERHRLSFNYGWHLSK
eukprot:417154-Rhodomonas_salina.1